MKKLFFVSALFFVILLLGACGQNKNVINATEENTILINKIENLSDYVFVDMQNKSEISVFIDSLKEDIAVSTGIKLRSEAAYKKNKYEILIGTTNREESIEAMNALGYFDFVIKHINNKIVIAAGSDEAMTEAMELFKSEFIDKEAKSLYLPDEFIYKYEYPVGKLSVMGTPIDQFKIYTGKSYIKSDFISEALCRTFDFELEIAEEMIEGEHYIILDATGMKYEDYSIKIEDGNIIIHGSARSVEKALGSFGEEFLRPLGAAEYDLTSADNKDGKIEKPELYTKEQLMEVITAVYDDTEHIIIGEQGRGTPDCVSRAISAFEKATGGEKPGIIGFDFSTTPGGIWNNDNNEDMQAKKSLMMCEMLEYVSDGGIITFSAHWANPSGNYPDEDNLYRGVLGYDYSKEAFEKAFVDLLTDGTEYNEFFDKLLTEEAEFFLLLQENGIPALWRPLHETNGNWFWFCTTMAGITLDASYIKNIWYYVYDYFAEKGVTNLLWTYSMSPSSNFDNVPGQSSMSTLYLYPGDEYCDIVGVDWYTEGGLEITNGSYITMTDHARKPGALTEFGSSGEAAGEDGKADPEKYNSMNVLRDLTELKGEGYSFSYLMTWGGSWSIAQMGMGKEFMAEEMTWGQAEVKALFDKLK